MNSAILLLGITLLGAFAVGQIFRRLGIPQVVGFIFAGLLMGPSFLAIIPTELNENLTFISEIALGLIGFDMGGHLHFEELRRLGKSMFWIAVLNVLGAFLLVAGGIFLITGSLPVALVFGALASATAPAATVDVLAEYNAEGPFTTTLIAVVGIDDALSLVIFSIAAAIAEAILVGSEVSWLAMVELPFIEIGESLLVGTVLGYVLSLIMKRLNNHHDSMAIVISIIFLCVGLTGPLHISLILTTMVMGIVIVNRDPAHGTFIRFTIEQAGPVLYVLFFALIGARLQVSLLPAMGVVGVSYIILRAIGKYAGAWLGAWLSGATRIVRNNLGLALLSQAGVAIGLAMGSYQRFCDCGVLGEELAALVLNVITATTLIVQIIGPIGVKLAITRAGEIGKAHQPTVGD
ncbi:MAG: cation:proton antiporter [Anaerolineae bacterium]